MDAPHPAADDLSAQLDAPDFDAVAFINKKFPTEESLGQLDTFIVGIGSQISVLDDEISRAVQAQSSANRQASTEIADAQASIQELFNKINDIKAKAAQSERMVHDICADIKKLDFAKTHLQASITSLKRLQMLSTAVGQLEVLRPPRPSASLLFLFLSQLLSPSPSFSTRLASLLSIPPPPPPPPHTRTAAGSRVPIPRSSQPARRSEPAAVSL